MLETIKSIILDFQDTQLETGIPRHLRIQPVRNKATVCIGVRRCGKSTFLYQIIKQLLDKGIPSENILYINFFDDRLHNLQHEGLSLITDAYYSIYPEKKNAEKIYCFFDEIQVLEKWESFVDRLMRTEKCEVYLTGSSAQMLSKEIATQMRGRALSWELFPFSFLEYLDCKEIEWNQPLSTKNRLLVQKAFVNYWETGGFPEIINQNEDLQIKIHQEYFSAILFRDLVERHDISHPKAISDLAHRLIDNTASLYSINGLTGYLKSLGHKAPKSAVSDYIEWFEDAYFLFTVRIYDSSLARSNTNPKKIYCVDHALVTSVSSGVLINSGHLLENVIFSGLRRISSKIFYYKTKNGLEVDFIVKVHKQKRLLIQVCESFQNPKTKQREVTALDTAMTELNITHGTIVTRNESAKITVKSGEIQVVPAWKYLIELNQYMD